MAYSATTAIISRTISGRRYAIVSVTEAELAAASEWSVEIPGGWRVATLVSAVATLDSGAGSTIDPILGTAAGFSASSTQEAWANGTAAAHIQATDLDKTFALGAGGLLVGRTTPDSGADNVATAIYILAEGSGR